MSHSHRGIPLTRRQVAGGLAGIALLPLGTGARATGGDQLSEALSRLTGGAVAKEGRVTLDLPALAENGFSVPLTITVDSPMSAADHVKAIHILSEKNPVAEVARFNLGPRAGRAKVSTSVRMADTQRVLAVAEMSDGSYWTGGAEIVVTLSACIDGG